LEEYRIVRLNCENKNEINFIAKIHDFIFSEDKDNYVADYRRIDRTVRDLCDKAKADRNFCHVAIFNGQIVGYVWIKKLEFGNMKLESLWTLECFRNNGIARLLCREATFKAKSSEERFAIVFDKKVSHRLAEKITLGLEVIEREMVSEAI